MARQQLPAAALVARRVLAAAVVALAAACASVETTEPGVVGVDRPQSMSPLVSEEDLDRGAADAYAQLLAQARAKGALNRDPAQTARVRTVAQRLIAQTPVFRADAQKWAWEVNVINVAEVNAWCMPGGKIAVYSGIIERLELTDAELAAVMGHEIAHALREHARERISRQMAAQTGTAIGAVALEIFTGIRIDPNLAGTVSQAAFVLPNSREAEQEADRIGVELAARAGYDPRAAVTLWQKMAKLGGSAPPQWLSTHPSNETRLQDLEVYTQKVMPLYRAAAR